MLEKKNHRKKQYLFDIHYSRRRRRTTATTTSFPHKKHNVLDAREGRKITQGTRKVLDAQEGTQEMCGNKCMRACELARAPCSVSALRSRVEVRSSAKRSRSAQSSGGAIPAAAAAAAAAADVEAADEDVPARIGDGSIEEAPCMPLLPCRPFFFFFFQIPLLLCCGDSLSGGELRPGPADGSTGGAGAGGRMEEVSCAGDDVMQLRWMESSHVGFSCRADGSAEMKESRVTTHAIHGCRRSSFATDENGPGNVAGS
jgi:hypothetical protein